MKKFFVVLLFFLLGCYSKSDFNNSNSLIQNEEKENFESKVDDVLGEIESIVVSIQDGDTIELRIVYNGKDAKERKGKNLRIRFAHIDCPERGKPFYKVAKKFTSDYCFGKVVKIVHNNEFDKYGRLIGEVILPDGENLNKLLLMNGLGTHFKKYSNSEEYSDLEEQAKQEGIGIWEQ